MSSTSTSWNTIETSILILIMTLVGQSRNLKYKWTARPWRHEWIPEWIWNRRAKGTTPPHFIKQTKCPDCFLSPALTTMNCHGCLPTAFLLTTVFLACSSQFKPSALVLVVSFKLQSAVRPAEKSLNSPPMTHRDQDDGWRRLPPTTMTGNLAETSWVLWAHTETEALAVPTAKYFQKAGLFLPPVEGILSRFFLFFFFALHNLDLIKELRMRPLALPSGTLETIMKDHR